ncbi:MAG: Hsp70 family protein [Chloroflexi bacterium]|nr:Hsp70 family protein [Chloroflexota bacterium]
MGYTLGIDFGTSTTKIALRRGGEIPHPLPIGATGDYFMPSVVAYQRTKNDLPELIAVGEDALGIAETDTVQVVQEVKRCLGGAGYSAKVGTDRYRWWNHREGCVELWSRKFSPEDVVMSILNQALERAVRRAQELGFGTDVDRFTIRGVPVRLGCSVTSDLEARKVLVEVARRLGFPDFKAKDLWEEPVLASLSYVHLEQLAPGETILIYDLGGGTFDTAVIKIDGEGPSAEPRLTVFAADGEQFCGGADIDEAFFRHLARRLAAEHFGLSSEEAPESHKLMLPDEKQLLRNRAREAKERLSAHEETPIPLPPGFLGESEITLRITRAELDRVAKGTGLLDKTLRCVLRCWRRARMLIRDETEEAGGFYLNCDQSGYVSGSVLRVGDEDIRRHSPKILIVGGATKMPLIRQRLGELWDEENVITEDVIKPVEAASIGAAWHHERKSAIVDRLPFSVVLRRHGCEPIELYQAFRPTVQYRTSDFSIKPFTESVPASCEEAAIVLKNADGGEFQESLLKRIPVNCTLQIDAFGRCVLMEGQHELQEIHNPYQHDAQKELWGRQEEKKRRQEEEEKKRLADVLKHVDHHDVG